MRSLEDSLRMSGVVDVKMSKASRGVAGILLCLSAAVVGAAVVGRPFSSEQIAGAATITGAEWKTLYEETTSYPSAKIQRKRKQVIISVTYQHSSATYVFTRPGHPAHPAVVIYDVGVVDFGGREFAQLNFKLAGSKRHFESWLKKFTYTPYALYSPSR